MARFLIGTIPAIGHVNPGLPIARTLVERGHEVWWYTGKGFKSTVEATGARFVPMSTGLDFSDPKSLPESFMEKKKSLTGLEDFRFGLKHIFIDYAVAQLKDFTEILHDFSADILLCDSLFLGASWVHEKTGLPWAAFHTSALFFTSRDTAPFGLGIQPNTSRFGHLHNHLLNWVY